MDGEGKITLTTNDKEQVEMYVIEETKLNGVRYILVAESEEDEAEAYIFKDISAETDEESIFVSVDDDTELEALMEVFDELLDGDIELDMLEK